MTTTPKEREEDHRRIITRRDTPKEASRRALEGESRSGPKNIAWSSHCQPSVQVPLSSSKTGSYKTGPSGSFKRHTKPPNYNLHPQTSEHKAPLTLKKTSSNPHGGPLEETKNKKKSKTYENVSHKDHNEITFGKIQEWKEATFTKEQNQSKNLPRKICGKHRNFDISRQNSDSLSP